MRSSTAISSTDGKIPSHSKPSDDQRLHLILGDAWLQFLQDRRSDLRRLTSQPAIALQSQPESGQRVADADLTCNKPGVGISEPTPRNSRDLLGRGRPIVVVPGIEHRLIAEAGELFGRQPRRLVFRGEDSTCCPSRVRSSDVTQVSHGISTRASTWPHVAQAMFSLRRSKQREISVARRKIASSRDCFSLASASQCLCRDVSSLHGSTYDQSSNFG